eukprot:PhF_6_TR18921/c5_g1_i1/m.27669
MVVWGKTMTTVRLVYDVIRGYQQHHYTPVFVSLPQILQYEPHSTQLKYASLSKYLIHQLVLPPSTEHVLKQQRLVVFLDSLDEVSVDLQEITCNNTKSLFALLGLCDWTNAIFVMTSRREIFPGRISFGGIHS